MNLFKLIGSIFIDNEKANDSISKTDEKAESLGTRFVKVAEAAVKWGTAVTTAAVGMATAAGAAITKVADDTREYRNEMGKLETAFESSNFTAEVARDTYESLQAILGETDQSVEAVNHLAKLCTTEEQLAAWTDICTGAYATFGASLPIEGLTEAANETAKTGALTGSLADALNWAGVNEDKFQEQLDACSNEQERQSLITKTLNALYSDAAEKYRENNAEVIKANAAQEKFNATMAKFGELAEPIVTKAKIAFTNFLNTLVPVADKVTQEIVPSITQKMQWLSSEIYQYTFDTIGFAFVVVKDRLSDLVFAFEPVISSVKNLIAEFINSGAPAELFLDIVYAIEGALLWLETKIIDATEKLKPFIDAFAEYIESGALVRDVTESVEKAVGFLADIYEIARSAVKAFVEELPDYITSGELARDATNGVNKALGFLTEKLEMVKSALQPYIEKIADYISSGEAAENVTEAVKKTMGLLRDAYQSAEKFLLNLIKGFKDAVQWGKEHQEALILIGIAIGTVTAEIGAYLVASNLKKISDTAELALIWLMVTADNAHKAAKAGYTAATSAATVATTAFKTALTFLTSPVGLVVAGIGALIAVIVLCVKHWDEIKEVALDIWEEIKNVWNNVASWFNKQVIKPLKEYFKGLWNDVQKVWDAICNVISVSLKLIASIISAAFQIITLPFQFIWQNCKDSVQEAWEWIKRTVSSALEAVKNTTTSIMNGIRQVINNTWNTVKSNVSDAVNSVKTTVTSAWNAVKSTTSSVFNSVKSTATSVWNGIKSAVTTSVEGVQSKVSSVCNIVKSTVSTSFNAVKSTATSVWNGIKTAITTPLENAKNEVKKVVDKIKEFFNFKVSLPTIKLPHFSIKPKGWELGDLLKGSIPTLGIEWYAKAMNDPMIMTKPTIFGYDAATGRLQGGGEAGSEVVSGTDTLMNMIATVVAGQNEELVEILYRVLEAIVAMDENMARNLREALEDMEFKINNREFARMVKAVV